VLPPMWELAFAKLEGQKVDALESAAHHGEMIYENVLAHFMRSSITSTESEGQNDTFQKGTRYIAEIMRDVINKYAIPQLIKYNYGNVAQYPQLRVRRIGDSTDWRTISFALRNFVGADLIRPDEVLEEYLREELDLPRADPSTVRDVATPQKPGGARVGPPRQSTAANNTQGKTAGSSRTGDDNSGG
jgi:hypothetical protein